MKEEKPNSVGPDPGGGNGGPLNVGSSCQEMGDGSSVPTPKGLQDELMLNGNDNKLENPSTPLLDPKVECPPDIPPLSELGHPDFSDCKPPMNSYCYNPHYNNNMPPNNMNMPPHPPGPGDYGPGPGKPGPGPGPEGPHPGGPHPHGAPMMGGYPPPNPSQPTKQQPSTLEAQYMQQQSQIFVFSTKLANKAAEAVFQQNFPSIIAFHMSQPATRKFLEKNPFKMNNFGRQFQGNPNWPPPPPPSGGKMGKGSKGGPPMMPMQGPPGPPPNMQPDFNMHQGPPPPSAPWNTHNSPKPQQQNYPNYYDGPTYGPGQCGGGMQQGGPGGPGPGPGHGPHSMGPCPGGQRPGPPGSRRTHANWVRRYPMRTSLLSSESIA